MVQAALKIDMAATIDAVCASEYGNVSVFCREAGEKCTRNFYLSIRREFVPGVGKGAQVAILNRLHAEGLLKFVETQKGDVDDA